MKPDTLKYLRYSKSIKWTKFLLKKHVPISDFSYDRLTGKVYIRSVDHSFNYGEFSIFFDGYSTYCQKFIDNGIKFIFEDTELKLQKGDLVFRIETLEELFITNEVFVDNVYSIQSNSDYIVFDIGMNVGITSLFLSQFDNIKYVYGFEPLRPTFASAKMNLELNKNFSKKIRSFNYGLSNKDKEISLKYDPRNKGNAGVKNTANSYSNLDHIEKIEVKEASGTLKKIIQNHPFFKVIAKLDCEGSEYDIIENLETASMLQEFDIFMIEWHNMENHKYRLHSIVQCFKENNFLVIGPGNLDSVAGMIYCFKDMGSKD